MNEPVEVIKSMWVPPNYGYKILCREVTKITLHYVWWRCSSRYSQGQIMKEKNTNFYNSFEEAKVALIERRKHEIERAIANLKTARDRLARTEQIEEESP